MDYTALIVLIAAFCWVAVTAAPTRSQRDAAELVVTPRWHRPCAGSNPADSTTHPIPVTAPPFHPHRHYIQLRKRAVESRNKTDRLLQRFLEERIKAPSDFLDSLEQMKLVGLPLIPARPNLTQDVPALLRNSHNWLMRFAVFLEQMRVDENVEIATEGDTVTMLEDIQILEEEAIYSLMCQLKLVMAGHELALEGLIGSEIAEEYENMEVRAKRHWKHVIILRDLARALRYIELAFDVVIAGHRPTTST